LARGRSQCRSIRHHGSLLLVGYAHAHLISTKLSILVTLLEIPARFREGNAAAFQACKVAFYRDLGMASVPHGLLLLPSIEDRKMSLHYGDGWDRESRQRGRALLGSTVLPGLQNNEPAVGVEQGVADLDRMLRAAHALAAPSK